MVILAIETSTKVCAAAVTADGKVIAARIDRENGNHARLLPVFVDELIHTLREKGLTLDAVALSEGPGSYTGLRIGTSTAKGLCYGWNIPLIPVPTTEVLCASYLEKQTVSNSSETLIPMIDARRMEVYTAQYDADIQPLTEIQACIVEGRESIGTADEAVFFGDGAEKCKALLETDKWHFVPEIVPDAACMFKLAEKRFAAGKACMNTAEVAYYEPFYLKEFVAAKSHVKGLES